MSARIIGTGSYLPDNIVTNDMLSKFVDTSDDWISSRTGIKARCISHGEDAAEMAIQASKKALECSGMDALELDYVIVATVTNQYSMPNTACQVQAAIGAYNAACFDLNAACTGFVFAYNTAQCYIKAGLAKHILIIGSETMSGALDWTDRRTCVLFGDGAGAVIVSDSSEGGFLETVVGSNGRKKDVLLYKNRSLKNLYIKSEQEDENYFIKMDGQEVFRFAVTTVPECIKMVLAKALISIEEIKYIVLHQANERIITSVAKRLKIDLDRFPMNLGSYGNTSAASIPILLDELNRTGRLISGDKIIITGFGGGLTWGATLLTW